MQQVTVFGISQCDQVRKTLAWLRAAGVAYRFHDFRVDGLDRPMLVGWCKKLPWTALVNKRGLSWRGLADTDRRAVVDQDSAIDLLIQNPTLVKRPVVQVGDRLLLGFSAERLAEALGPCGTMPALQPGAASTDDKPPADTAQATASTGRRAR